MKGVIIVGNIVYYMQNEKLLGYATVKELSNTTQTTVIFTREVENV